MTHFDMADDLPVHDETDSVIALFNVTTVEAETDRERGESQMLSTTKADLVAQGTLQMVIQSDSKQTQPTIRVEMFSD